MKYCHFIFFSDNHYLVTLMFSRKKSQGSEFDRVLLVLPDHLSEVLSRELLYTAVTRARSSIEIWGSEELFCRAVERRTLRISGLGELLAARGAAA